MRSRRANQVGEKASESSSEEETRGEQPRSVPRPGSCCCTRSGQDIGRPVDHSAATRMGAGAGMQNPIPNTGSTPTPRPTSTPPGFPPLPESPCRRCLKFGIEECWTHPPIKCAVCKKRGRTCPCAKKQAQHEGKIQKKLVTKKPPDTQEDTECEAMRKNFMANRLKGEEAQLELR